MTPRFTTPCYVRIEDKNKRKEVCDKIKPVGYKIKVDYTDDINPIVVASKLGILYDASSFKGVPDFIDCGTNIPLFLELAGMRKDTDKGQLFINESLGKMFRCKDRKFPSFYVDWEDGLTNIRDDFKRATAQEIINHHKQK